MATGTESEEFMAGPSVRVGLKREFEFAVKSHAEIRRTLGRTRSAKRKAAQLELTSDSEDPSHDEFDRSDESNGTGSFCFPVEELKPEDLEEKMGLAYFPAEVETMVVPKARANHGRSEKKFPSRLKDLLSSGILEGLNVRYTKGPKAREADYKPLRGVISGSGILCHCDTCSGTYVVTPTEFELHASSRNKRPPEYIQLDNGNTLRDVITACHTSSLLDLEQSLRTLIGVFVIQPSSICYNCKQSLAESVTRKSSLYCDSCVDLIDSQVGTLETADHYSNYASPNPPFIPKHSNCEAKFNSSQSESKGRITKKDTRLHKRVFEEDNIPDGTQLAYYVRGKKYMTGYKKGFGIFCYCCNFEISPSQFEAHAGWATRRKPYVNICTSNGVSLHDLSVLLARNGKFYSFVKDDLCFVCHGGGDFVCCNGCPRVFHAWCLNVPNDSGDVWYCKLCRNMFEKNKYVGQNYNATAAGREEGVDPMQQIANRCIRIMNTEDFEFGGCALCKGHDFSKFGFDSLTVLFCDQCEKEFHVGCLKNHGLEDLKDVPEGMWFCCSDCRNISHSLQELTVNGPEKLPEPLLKFIKNEQSEDSMELDVKWRIINWKVASDEESELLLSEALAIFHDRFTPITDPATSRDLIPEMLYGNSFMGQDFSRMYCAVLTVNGCAVLAGIFRVYGTEVVELPLVATNAKYQGQGYFKAWFSCFQRFLELLKVRNLVLPSAAEAESIWTNKFGFTKIDVNLLNEYKRQYQLMIFQGATVLWKPVPMAEQ